jgi:hypothetical protein
MRKTVGVPRKVEGGGWHESKKACESQQMNVDIVQNVQSSDIWLFGYPVIRVRVIFLD